MVLLQQRNKLKLRGRIHARPDNRNNGCEGEYSNCDSDAVFFFFFFLLSIVQTLVSIEHAMPVSGFISDKPEGFSLSIKRYFRGNLLKVNPFFFFFYKNAAISYLVTHPNPPIPKVTLACVACLIKYLW